jgi:hypothetical protein
MIEEQASDFEQAVIERLEPHRAELVVNLRQLIRHEYAPGVARLHFEVYCDQFLDTFPVSFFYLDEKGDECGLGDATWPKVGDLVEAEELLDEEFLEDEQFEGLDTMTASGQALIIWFADCWQAAGGKNFPFKATIRLHDAEIYDAGRYHDLVGSRWEQFP